MTKEEKQTLLKKVVCEQLPYGVKVKNDVGTMCDNEKSVYTIWYHPHIGKCLPYLRPLSSMTQIEARDIAEMGLHIPAKEIISVNVIANGIAITFENLGLRDRQTEVYPFDRIVCSLDIFDYLNKKHFDIRGLIPMGLAIAAVGENDPYMEKGGVE